MRNSYNESVLLYHYVYPAKYRKGVIDQKIDEILKEVSLEIAKRQQIEFNEIGTDQDHVHFLIRSVPAYNPAKIIQTVKSLAPRKIFKQAPEVKRKLWGGEFWSDGYYVSMVGRHGSEETIRKYVKEQGKEEEYQQIYEQQLKLF